jgi:hypothetical protein
MADVELGHGPTVGVLAFAYPIDLPPVPERGSFGPGLTSRERMDELNSRPFFCTAHDASRVTEECLINSKEQIAIANMHDERAVRARNGLGQQNVMRSTLLVHG